MAEKRVPGQVKVPGQNVVRLVLQGLARERLDLKSRGMECAAELLQLAKAGHLGVRLVHPPGPELTNENDFSLVFNYDVTEGEYLAAVGHPPGPDHPAPGT
jgi:hypothetical protein